MSGPCARCAWPTHLQGKSMTIPENKFVSFVCVVFILASIALPLLLVIEKFVGLAP